MISSQLIEQLKKNCYFCNKDLVITDYDKTLYWCKKCTYFHGKEKTSKQYYNYNKKYIILQFTNINKLHIMIEFEYNSIDINYPEEHTVYLKYNPYLLSINLENIEINSVDEILTIVKTHLAFQ